MAQAQIKLSSTPTAPVKRQKPEGGFRSFHIMIYLLLAVFTITSVGPFIFSFFSTFKTFRDILAFPPSLFPPVWTLENYRQVLSDGTILRWLLNSFIFAICVMVLNVLFSALAGYALSRMNFPGRKIIFIATLAVMMIPTPV